MSQGVMQFKCPVCRYGDANAYHIDWAIHSISCRRCGAYREFDPPTEKPPEFNEGAYEWTLSEKEAPEPFKPRLVKTTDGRITTAVYIETSSCERWVEYLAGSYEGLLLAVRAWACLPEECYQFPVQPGVTGSDVVYVWGGVWWWARLEKDDWCAPFATEQEAREDLQARIESDSPGNATPLQSSSSPDTCHCDKCGWAGGVRDVDRIDDLYERIEPGDIMPAGQCPRCSALVHLDVRPTQGFTVGRTHIQYQEVDEGLYVHVHVAERDCHLAFKFTAEGLILDQLDDDGEVAESFGRMYDELNDVDKGI